MPPSAKKQRTEPGSAGSSSNDMEPPEETVSVRRILVRLSGLGSLTQVLEPTRVAAERNEVECRAAYMVELRAVGQPRAKHKFWN